MAILSVFLSSSFSEYDYEAPLEKWTAILRLAHMWQFPKVKSLAMRKMDKLDIEPVDKAVIARDYKLIRRLAGLSRRMLPSVYVRSRYRKRRPRGLVWVLLCVLPSSAKGFENESSKRRRMRCSLDLRSSPNLQGPRCIPWSIAVVVLNDRRLLLYTSPALEAGRGLSSEYRLEKDQHLYHTLCCRNPLQGTPKRTSRMSVSYLGFEADVSLLTFFSRGFDL